MSKRLGMDLWLKKDYLQVTGSFKERGARYSIIKLSPEEKKKGVITTSAGNHAQVRRNSLIRPYFFVQWVLQIKDSLFLGKMGEIREIREFPHLPFLRSDAK